MIPLQLFVNTFRFSTFFLKYHYDHLTNFGFRIDALSLIFHFRFVKFPNRKLKKDTLVETACDKHHRQMAR